MVGMTAILVVAAIAVTGAVIARVTWRRPADERHSIQSHQQTLDTLRSMADRRPGAPRDGAPSTPARPKSHGGHVQTGATPPAPVAAPPPRPAPARSGAARAGSARSGSARAPSSGGAVGDELVFVDDGLRAGPRGDGSPRISPLVSVKGLHRADRIDRLTRGRHGGGGGRLLPAAAAVVVLGIVVAVAVALAPSHHGTPQARAKPPRTKASGHVTHDQPPVTTQPQVQPTTSTSVTADYGAPSTGYTVNVDATGLCWVDATQQSSGAVVWTGTLQPGQTQAIAASGSLTLRLGAANDVSVTLNGVPVVLPTGFHSPFDMRFDAA